MGGRAERPSPSRHVFGNALSSWVRDGVEAVIFLVLTPFVIRAVGTEQYGLWSLVWAMVSVLALVDMGFATSTVKLVADARGRDDDEGHRSTVATFFWTYMAQAAVLLALVAWLSMSIESLFSIPAEHVEVARALLWILGGTTAVGLPIGMFRGVIMGHQRQRVANLYKLGGSIVYFTSALLVLSWIPDLRALAAVNALFFLFLPLVAIAVHAASTLPGVTIRPSRFQWPKLRTMWGFSVYFMLIHVATIIASRVDTFVVQWALDLRAVAVYAIAMRLSEKAAQICLQLSRTIAPVVAELHGSGDEDQLREVWIRGTKFSVAFAVPVLLGLAYLAEPLIVAWAGPDFAGSAPVLQILMIAMFMIAVHANSHNLLSMRGQHRQLAFVVIGGQVLNLGLSLALVHPFGLVGVASATAVSSVLVNAVAVHGYVRRRYGTRLLQLYRLTVLPSALPAALMLATFHAWNVVHGIHGLVEVALVGLAGVVTFWMAFWWMGCDETEKALFRERLRKLRPA